VKSIGEMTRLEMAAFVATALDKRNIRVVLSGGACVSIYSNNKYVSMDLDLINVACTKSGPIRLVMESLGFHEKNRYFRHPATKFLVEFPPGPLGVGEEPVKQIDEIETATGTVRILSPTDCVKDRLTWYYHDKDTECLEQAVLVAQNNEIDLMEIKRWSKVEGKSEEFERIRNRLNKTRQEY
jgi:hypothetical protein